MEGRSMVRDLRALTGFFLGALLASPLWAQDDKAPDDKATFTQDIRIVMTPVTVTDRTGIVINGLSPTDFRLLDNGKPQKITEDIAVHPISMVIVIQANAEVEKMLPAVQKLASAIQSQVLGDDGEAAVLEFDHRIQNLSDFTSDPDKLSAALKKLRPGSSSSRLNDATIEGINILRRRPNSRRKVLLLISESRDNGSEIKSREVLSAAEFANIVIYSIDISHLVASVTAPPSATRSVLDNRPPGAVHLPAGVVETPTTQSQQNMGNWMPLVKDIFLAAKGLIVANPLEVYTKYTGGREYSFKTQKDLERAVSELGEELHSQYLLTYRPNNEDEAGYHNIVVQVLKPGLTIRSRDGYYWAGSKVENSPKP
jgi:VWFA-related protein